jgi:hypothetical protein
MEPQITTAQITAIETSPTINASMAFLPCLVILRAGQNDLWPDNPRMFRAKS